MTFKSFPSVIIKRISDFWTYTSSRDSQMHSASVFVCLHVCVKGLWLSSFSPGTILYCIPHVAGPHMLCQSAGILYVCVWVTDLCHMETVQTVLQVKREKVMAVLRCLLLKVPIKLQLPKKISQNVNNSKITLFVTGLHDGNDSMVFGFLLFLHIIHRLVSNLFLRIYLLFLITQLYKIIQKHGISS